MKYQNGKSNLAIVQDYLDGVRPFVITGYTGKPYIKRTLGDQWTDNNGILWEQKASGPVRVNKVADLIRSNINHKCECGQDIKFGTRLDNIFFRKTGLCENCLIDYETKLHIVGVYSDYEQYKLISNEISYLTDAKGKIKEVIKFFSENSGDVEMVCNSEGFIEKWKNTNQEQIVKDASADLKLITQRIKALNKKRNVHKKNYIAGAKKYKLKVYANR